MRARLQSRGSVDPHADHLHRKSPTPMQEALFNQWPRSGPPGLLAIEALSSMKAIDWREHNEDSSGSMRQALRNCAK